LASELSPVRPAPVGWGGLVGAPETILDLDAAREALDGAARGVSDRGETRKAGVAVLSEANAAGRAAIAGAIAADPRSAHRAVHDYAWLTDAIVTLTLDFAAKWLHPLASPTASERIAAIAVGGYGRAEMAPFSDVDLLFLTPYKQTPWGESLIESVLYCLWDLKMKVGHAVRTVDDCLRLGRSDATIRTTLLEHRAIWGDQRLAVKLSQRLWSDLFDSTGPEYLQLKLIERAARHERQGSTRYLLEPNVKEGKGGLRDLRAPSASSRAPPR
jgi:[protein-PII] uridylyltransferase